MNEQEERAYKYRQKAEGLRAMIPDMTDDQARQTLENIAKGYDHLANVQDGLARTHKSVSKL